MKLKNIAEGGLEIPDEKGILFTIRAGETIEWNGDVDTPLIRTRIAAKELEVVEAGVKGDEPRKR